MSIFVEKHSIHCTLLPYFSPFIDYQDGHMKRFSEHQESYILGAGSHLGFHVLHNEQG